MDPKAKTGDMRQEHGRGQVAVETFDLCVCFSAVRPPVVI